MTDQIFQVGLYLGLIVGLILLMGFVAKKISPMAVGTNTAGMKVVSSLPLGMKEKLVLVQVGDQQVLLGVTQHNISKIENFSHPVVTPDAEGLSDFRFKLQEMMQKQS